MRIAEIYRSVQGEGRLTGTPSVFVRTSGCNLRCGYCDTPYASWAPEGDDLSIAQIEEAVIELETPHVVLSGGEPMLFAELIPLAENLRRAGRHVTIETSGTLYLPVSCDLMSISPKTANATPSLETAGAWRARHERARHAPAVVERLLAEHDYQLKFVIAEPADCDEVLDYLANLPGADRGRVWLMPRGTELTELRAIEQWLAPYCREHQFQFCPRRQIEWFGLVRGT